MTQDLHFGLSYVKKVKKLIEYMTEKGLSV